MNTMNWPVTGTATPARLKAALRLCMANYSVASAYRFNHLILDSIIVQKNLTSTFSHWPNPEPTQRAMSFGCV